VAHVRAAVPEPVLECVGRDVNDIVDVLHRAPAALRAGHKLLLEDAHHLQPRVVDFYKLPDRRIVAQHVHFGGFPQNAYQSAAVIVGFVEKPAFGELQAVDRAVGRPDPIEVRDILGRLRQRSGRMQRPARGHQFHGIDICLQNTHVPFGKPRRGTAALLQFFLAHGRAGVDQDISHAKLLDEAQRFLARTGPDRHHADHRAHAEYDSQGGKQRASLLSAQIPERLTEVGKKDHLVSAFITPPDGEAFAALLWSGLESATCSPSAIPAITAWLSLRRTSVTSRGTKPCGVFTYTNARPSLSNNACEGVHRTSSSDSTVIRIFEVIPGRSSGPVSSSAMRHSNRRSQADPEVPPRLFTCPRKSRPGIAAARIVTFCPGARWPRSSSGMLALTSQLLMSGICATAWPPRAASPT